LQDSSARRVMASLVSASPTLLRHARLLSMGWREGQDFQ